MKKFLICYFFFLFFLFSFFASGVIDSQDGFQYLAVARNIYYTGEPTAPSPLDHDIDKNIHLSTEIGRNGKAYSSTGLGYSLAMLPAVAITDIVYKIYHVTPPVYFPLEADWLILMMGSLTNCFFAAVLGVVIFLYFATLGLNKKQSLFLSIVTLFTTNLFAYSKHSFAHMMFVTFLMLSFLCLKLFSGTKKRIYLFISGLAYGIMMISYNQTYILTIIPYFIYFLFSIKPKKSSRPFTQNFLRQFKSKSILKGLGLNPIILIIGIIPFIYINSWFNFIRYGVQGSSSAASTVNYISSYFQVGVIFEGLYGLLLSPGRSIFIYSPLLLIIFIFWHKINKKVLPELTVFIIMSVIYVAAFASSFSLGASDQGVIGLWHGEYSWGPRYLLPLIPLGMLIIGVIYKKMSKKVKMLVFLPLMIVGLYVEILGVAMPYQIKFQDLDYSLKVNNTVFMASAYSNLLPRYSPILMMSKKLIKLIKNLPSTLSHGFYNIRYYDGIDFPFNVGGLDRWRTIDSEGRISFDSPKTDPINKIAFNFINHPLVDTASSSAYVNFWINNKKLYKEDQIFNLAERKFIDLPVTKNALTDKNNELVIAVRFDNNAEVIKKHTQIFAMMSMFVNGKEVNKESIDVPYLSQFGPKITGATYKNWGGINKSPWVGWNIHTQIFERVPDFWWAKAVYYWDFPKKVFLIFFIFDLSAIVFFGYKVYYSLKKL